LSWASPDIRAASPGRTFNNRKRIRVMARMVGINWRMRRRANLSIFSTGPPSLRLRAERRGDEERKLE